MKKRISLIAVLLVAVLCISLTLAACDKSGAAGGSSSGKDELVIYNWEQYIDTGIIPDFEQYYYELTGRRLEITYTTFDTNETMMTKVLKNDANVDLICPSEYAIEKLMSAGFVKNLKEVENRLTEQYGGKYTFDNMHSNIEPEVMSAITTMFSAVQAGDKTYDMTEYMVPYMWGTLGLLYNKNVVSEEELEKYGWGMLWNESNNPELEGKILVKDSIRDTYCAAVLYLKEYNKLPDGVSATHGVPYSKLSVADLINCTDDALLKAAEEALTEQRDHIAGYEVDFGKDDMLNEIVYLDLAWSGDALWAIEESYDEEADDYLLGYYVPEIGSNIWYDGWIIPTSAKNELAAMLFIDYMCTPRSGARNTGYIGYTSAVAKDKLMSDQGAIDALLDVEYLWYASSEECKIFFDADGNSVFRYEWTEGDVYYLYTDGSEAEIDDENALTPADYETDEDGYYLTADGENIVDADAMSYFFFDKGRYPEITETLGVMRDFGSANDKVVQMWERAKAGTDTPWVLIWCLIAITAVVGIFAGAYFLKEYLKRRPRKLPKDASLSPDNGDDTTA